MIKRFFLLALFVLAMQLTLRSQESKNVYNDSLLIASEKGDFKKVLTCIRNGADVNYRSPYDSISALMYASQEGHLDIVKVLVYNGANPNARPYNGVTPLIAAATTNQVDVADYLIQHGANVNVKDNDSVSSLHLAAGYGYWIMADMLIFYGANLNAVTTDGATPVYTAAYRGDTALCNLLIGKGANLHKADNMGFSPLLVTAQQGHLQTMQLLIDKGAIISEKTNAGLSILDIAINNNRKQVVEWLLNNLDKQKLNSLISTGTKKQTLISRNKKIITLMRQQGVSYKWPYFERIFLTYSTNWNFHDITMGGNVGIRDVNYNTSYFVGADYRIAAKRVLVEQPTYYYQFWEKRHNFYTGIRKYFNIYNLYGNQFGLLAGIKGIYSTAKYRATDNMKPSDIWKLAPEAGAYWNFHHAGAFINYEYLDLNVHKISPHRINVGFQVFIHTSKSKKKIQKEIHWL